MLRISRSPFTRTPSSDTPSTGKFWPRRISLSSAAPIVRQAAFHSSASPLTGLSCAPTPPHLLPLKLARRWFSSCSTIQALAESGQPIRQAEVRLVGEHDAAQGLTDKQGKVELTLYGELPETITELLIRPRSGYRGLWRHQPELQADAANTFTLESLSPPGELDWGGKAMRFDQLPAECRGAGIKIALIDSGVAISHKQLTRIDHGVDIRNREGRSWSQDAMGHGTACAGIIGAIPDGAHGIRGYAYESELHVCRLPVDARCSDLVAALDYCLQSHIDVACLGFGCERGSAIVE